MAEIKGRQDIQKEPTPYQKAAESYRSWVNRYLERRGIPNDGPQVADIGFDPQKALFSPSLRPAIGDNPQRFILGVDQAVIETPGGSVIFDINAQKYYQDPSAIGDQFLAEGKVDTPRRKGGKKFDTQLMQGVVETLKFI